MKHRKSSKGLHRRMADSLLHFHSATISAFLKRHVSSDANLLERKEHKQHIGFLPDPKHLVSATPCLVPPQQATSDSLTILTWAGLFIG